MTTLPLCGTYCSNHTWSINSLHMTPDHLRLCTPPTSHSHAHTILALPHTHAQLSPLLAHSHPPSSPLPFPSCTQPSPPFPSHSHPTVPSAAVYHMSIMCIPCGGSGRCVQQTRGCVWLGSFHLTAPSTRGQVFLRSYRRTQRPYHADQQSPTASHPAPMQCQGGVPHPPLQLQRPPQWLHTQPHTRRLTTT